MTLSLTKMFTTLNEVGRFSGSFWKGIWCSFDGAAAINQFKKIYYKIRIQQ
jgi:hypothetical protein